MIASQAVMQEETTIRAAEKSRAPGCSTSTYRFTSDYDVTLNRMAFTGFCFRCRKDGHYTFSDSKGEVTLPNSSATDPESDWPARDWYSHTRRRCTGGKTVASAVIDHPSNPPTAWHGARSVSFLNPVHRGAGAVKIPAGKPLTLRYRAVARDGRFPDGLLDRMAADGGARSAGETVATHGTQMASRRARIGSLVLRVRPRPGHCRSIPHAELVAAAWDDKAQLDAFTASFGIKGYADYRELLDREDVDIVHIASPVARIPELTIHAAGAGKHIVLGKPMAMTVAEADRMVEAVERAGVVCVPFQGIMRLRGAELKARIDAGEIGDVVVLHQTSRWSIAEDWYKSGTPGWFADPTQVPGGAFIDEGIYWIDFFRWLSASEVIAGGSARWRNLVHNDIAVEDWGMATFTFANGIIATLEASWTINAPRKSGPSPKQNSCRATGDRRHAGRDHRAVVSHARARRARGRRQRLGVRAAS